MSFIRIHPPFIQSLGKLKKVKFVVQIFIQILHYFKTAYFLQEFDTIAFSNFDK